MLTPSHAHCYAPLSCLYCRAVEKLLKRFHVISALPLLIFTLLRHEDALRQEYGDEAYEHAVATCNAAFYGTLIAPGVAQIRAAAAALGKELGRFSADVDARETASQKVADLVDPSKLKTAVARRCKPDGERQRMEAHFGQGSTAKHALADGFGKRHRRAKELMDSVMDTAQQRMTADVPDMVSSALRGLKLPNNPALLGRYLQQLQSALVPHPDVRHSWRARSLPLASRLTAQLPQSAKLPQLLQEQLVDGFSGEVEALVREVVTDTLVDFIVQAGELGMASRWHQSEVKPYWLLHSSHLTQQPALACSLLWHVSLPVYTECISDPCGGCPL